MILQIDSKDHWVGFKPAKGNMPDSFLVYGGVNLGQFHSEGMLSSGLEKATSQRKSNSTNNCNLDKYKKHFYYCTGASHS